jgi:cell wall-associated NlpC family hydrolase
VTVQHAIVRAARTTRRRLAAGGTVLALAALTFSGPSSPALADRTYPTAGQVAASKAHVATKSHQVGAIEARLAAASARQAQLAVEVAQAVEAYNGARFRLEQAVTEAITAQQRADDAKAGVVSSQRELGAFAAAVYRSGGDLTTLSAILSAQGPRDLISRAAAIQSIGATRENALDQLTSARAVAGVLQTRADDMVTKRQQAADEVALAKRAAESRLAEQQAAVDEIATQRRSLVRELAAARHTSVQLEQARQAGIAAAQRAAERRAEARRRAAAQQSSGGNGGGGGSGSGDSGGGSPGTGGSSSGTSTGAQAAIDYARAQIGKPYEWGATGPDTFDCSGLTMRAWEQGGVQLPHYSVAQYEQAGKVAMGDIRPGDLVFFGSNKSDHNSIYHVGLYIGGGNMIEAPYTGANVRISSIWRSSLFGAARP